jgi:hypothetical protein
MRTLTPAAATTGDPWTAPRVPARDRVRPPVLATASVLLVAAASVAVFVLSGSPVYAVVPLILATVGYAVWTLPLRHSLYPFLFVSFLVFDPPHGHAGEDIATGMLWQSVLKPAYAMLYVNLNKLTGIEALRVTGSELIYLVFLALMLVRVARHVRTDSEGRIAGCNALNAFCAAAFLTMLGLEVWGAARGGDVRGSFFQIRPLIWLPVLTGIFSYALRDQRDFLIAAIVVSAAACIKIGLGAFVLLYDIRAKGLNPEYMTGHHDTVLFVAVLFLGWAAWVHRPTLRRLSFTMALSGWLVFGLVLNNRRLAWVGLLASFFVLYTLLEGRMKRSITRIVIGSIPLIAVYLLASRHYTGGIFKPGAQITSVARQQDASSIWRDIENVNLLATLRANPVLGSGWGHEYIEVVKADDISRFMPQYRLVPHNDILWLLGVAGIVGFTLLWLPIAVGAFLAARSYYCARTPAERTAAATALAILILYANQAWGDMGVLGTIPTVLVAAALAMTGKLARVTGAWPAGVALLTRRARASRSTAILATPEPEPRLDGERA